MAIKRINCEILVDSNIWDPDLVCDNLFMNLAMELCKDEYLGIQISNVEVVEDGD